MFVLFNFLIAVGLSALGLAISAASLSPISIIYGLAVLVPSLSVTVRRLHDTDRSGWWLLICFVPFIGWLVLLIFLVLEGKRARNRFGPDPKRVGAEI